MSVSQSWRFRAPLFRPPSTIYPAREIHTISEKNLIIYIEFGSPAGENRVIPLGFMAIVRMGLIYSLASVEGIVFRMCRLQISD